MTDLSVLWLPIFYLYPNLAYNTRWNTARIHSTRCWISEPSVVGFPFFRSLKAKTFSLSLPSLFEKPASNVRGMSRDVPWEDRREIRAMGVNWSISYFFLFSRSSLHLIWKPIALFQSQSLFTTFFFCIFLYLWSRSSRLRNIWTTWTLLPRNLLSQTASRSTSRGKKENEPRSNPSILHLRSSNLKWQS